MGAGAPGQALLSMLMQQCALEGLAELHCAEGLVPIWDGNVAGRLDSLRVLHLASCGLSSLPGGAHDPSCCTAVQVSRQGLSSVCRFMVGR